MPLGSTYITDSAQRLCQQQPPFFIAAPAKWQYANAYLCALARTFKQHSAEVS